MLVEIYCDKFMENGKPRGKISFHSGLNTVLGGDAGDNSIGKSTFLMVIDFVFGGNDYVEKLKDVQQEIGEHVICFAFRFNNQMHYFSRSNTDYKTVHKCDASYRHLENGSITLSQYLDFLRVQYGIANCDLSFREAVGFAMRIYGRDTLDEGHPLQEAKQEKQGSAIERLLKLTGRYASIEDLYHKCKEAEDDLEAFKGARKREYFPYTKTKSEYNQNIKSIAEYQRQLDELELRSKQNLLDLDSVQADYLAKLKARLSYYRRERTRQVSQLQKIKDGQSSRIPFVEHFDDLMKFFPDIDIQRIEQTELFHRELVGILNSEVKAETDRLDNIVSMLDAKILETENEIKGISKETCLSKVVLEEYASIKSKLNALEIANANYLKLNNLESEVKEAKRQLDDETAKVITDTQADVNATMAGYNTKIYADRKTSPELDIKGINSYTFSTPKDGGTGTQYKGLIVFDMAMLELTPLPVIVHDSVILKPIENDAMENIFKIYNATPKQVFIAIDRASGYTQETQNILESTQVLRLSAEDGSLYGRAWNAK
ncbi:MAG: DUF2326 domain-containing protein [Clostridia bacterium]|nr:DUF2326 domain-containing protein [Clostridia bacterium]